MLGMLSIGACIGEVDGPDDAGDTAANDGTGAVEQALTPADIVDYTFPVCTCNVPDAGTDANIWTFLTGLNNGTEVSTTWFLLDNPGIDDHERGRCYSFSGTPGLRNQVNVGTPMRLTIYNDGAGKFPEWAMCRYSVVMHIHDGTTRTFTHTASSPEWTGDDYYGRLRDFYGFTSR